jgi:hypothetical protein
VLAWVYLQLMEPVKVATRVPTDVSAGPGIAMMNSAPLRENA